MCVAGTQPQPTDNTKVSPSMPIAMSSSLCSSLSVSLPESAKTEFRRGLRDGKKVEKKSGCGVVLCTCTGVSVLSWKVSLKLGNNRHEC